MDEGDGGDDNEQIALAEIMTGTAVESENGGTAAGNCGPGLSNLRRKLRIKLRKTA